MQTPQGFISAGDKTITSGQDILFALKYVGVLDHLISKGFVQHVRDASYSLTLAGWSRVR